MSVVLDPKDVFVFERPFRDGLKRSITIKNPSDKYVAFKFKTTAPRHYCVRPNAGFVAPLQSLDVSVIFQPRTDIDSESKCKDKFLVVSVVCPGNESDTLREPTDFWADAEKSLKDTFKEQRLRCEFADSSYSGAVDVSTSEMADKNDLSILPTPEAKPYSNPLAKSSVSSVTRSPNLNTVTATASPIDSPSLKPKKDIQNTDNSDNNLPQLAAKSIPKNEPLSLENNSSVQIPAVSSTPAVSLSSSGDWMRERESLLKELAALKGELLLKNSLLANSTKSAASSKPSSTPSTTTSSSAARGLVGPNEGKDGVVTRMIINPGTYSQNFVIIVAVVSFLLGIILY